MSAKRMGRHEAFGPQRVRHPPLAHVVVRAAPCLDRADTAGTRRVVHEEKARPGKEAPAPANMQRVVRSMRRAAAWLRPSCFLPSCFAAFRMRRRSGAGIGRRHALDGMGRRVRPHGSRQGDAIGAGRACRKPPSCASSWGLCPRPSSKPPLLRRPSCRPACSPTRKGLVHCGTCRASPSSRHRLAKRLLRGRGPGEEAARLRKTEPLREAKPADGRIRHRKTP